MSYEKDSRLNFDMRMTIQALLAQNKSLSFIGLKTGFNKSTISREIKKAFEVCLSNNGSEFDNFYEIEEDKDTKQHLVNVFFTRTYRSTDKAECER